MKDDIPRWLRDHIEIGGDPRGIAIYISRGNALLASSGSGLKTAHPRACGEHGAALRPYPRGFAAHPRACGDRSSSPRSGSQAAHPRACGERDGDRQRVQSSGSSPRVRGTLFNAWATICENGSSPRVRGTHLDALDAERHPRLIPARAGNASCSPAIRCARRLIPARAGNAGSAEVEQFSERGSSPRVRGTRRTRWRCVARGRLIPARAGNASIWSRQVILRPAHPRACGERSSQSILKFLRFSGRPNPAFSRNPKPPPGPTGARSVHVRPVALLRNLWR